MVAWREGMDCTFIIFYVVWKCLACNNPTESLTEMFLSSNNILHTCILFWKFFKFAYCCGERNAHSHNHGAKWWKKKQLGAQSPVASSRRYRGCYVTSMTVQELA